MTEQSGRHPVYFVEEITLSREVILYKAGARKLDYVIWKDL